MEFGKLRGRRGKGHRTYASDRGCMTVDLSCMRDGFASVAFVDLAILRKLQGTGHKCSYVAKHSTLFSALTLPQLAQERASCQATSERLLDAEGKLHAVAASGPRAFCLAQCTVSRTSNGGRCGIQAEAEARADAAESEAAAGRAEASESTAALQLQVSQLSSELAQARIGGDERIRKLQAELDFQRRQADSKEAEVA